MQPTQGDRASAPWGDPDIRHSARVDAHACIDRLARISKLDDVSSGSVRMTSLMSHHVMPRRITGEERIEQLARVSRHADIGYRRPSFWRHCPIKDIGPGLACIGGDPEIRARHVRSCVTQTHIE
jgi:hypothetical protein